MKQYHKPHKKKVGSGSGGRRRKSRDKKKCHIGGDFISTKVSEKDSRVKIVRRGSNTTTKLKKAAYMNVLEKGTGKKYRVLRVLDSHNPEYVRMNIITKGAVLEIEGGKKAKVTNRVGQDGVINGIFVS